MDRRRFLQLVTGAGVTTATMAEAGFFAEFWSWLTRRPKWFIPKETKQFYGVIHPQAAYDLMYDPLKVHEISADAMIPELHSLSKLATIYYDRKALDTLQRQTNMLLATTKTEVINYILRYGHSHVKVDWKR